MMRLEQLSKKARTFFDMIEFDSDEELICEIRKHPFGLFLIYFSGAFVIVGLLVAGLLINNWIGTDIANEITNTTQYRPLVLILTLVLVFFTAIVTLLGAFIYQSSVVLLTSEKIAQVLYRTIFDRKISQLSIGDVQDVTVSQKGVFARLFNYGTLVIETAGEQQNYTFTFTPYPYQCSKDIVGAHERSVAKYGN